MSKKIMNQPENCVSEALAGFLSAHPEYVQVEDASAIRVRDLKEKTAMIVGGGSGHEPMFGYFVGQGLADASVIGNVFTSPDPGSIFKAAMEVNQGKGILFVYGNYSGDNMNFDIAAEMLDDMGIATKTVRGWDDVASASKENYQDRRGIAGIVPVIKIAGAASAKLSLEEAYRVACKARDNVYSIGFGLSGATIPGEKNPIFTLGDDEMEYGLGIHGEPGVRRVKLQSADVIVEELVDKILEDSGIQAGDTVCTLVNGLGATPLLELYIMNRKLAEVLAAKGIHVHDMDVGTYVTSLEMAGASVTLMKMDEELPSYYDMPCRSPHFKRG